MNEIILHYAVHLGAAAALMTMGWLISLLRKNVTIADVLWGPGFVLIIWLAFARTDGWLPRQLLVAGLVTIWGLRLMLHLGTRSLRKPEDPRYASWRARAPHTFWIVSLFKVFLIQSLFQFLISFSAQHALRGQPALNWFDLAGVLLWATGFFFETTADLQLRRFLANPFNRGAIMQNGLWRYSRHPNYFGESCMWWGLYLVSLQSDMGWLTVFSPILITWTLLRVTGVSLMEKTIFAGNPDYGLYVAKTSSFFPLPPKKRRQAG